MENLFSNYQLPPKKKVSKRGDVIKELYQLYLDDKISRKKENWKRYIQELKNHSWRDTPEHREHFKKSKLYIKEYPISTFCFLISHIKVDDLFLMLSEAKDRKHRGQNVGGYIAGHFSK